MQEHLHLSIDHIALMGTAIALFYLLVRWLFGWMAGHTPAPLSNLFIALGAIFPAAGGTK